MTAPPLRKIYVPQPARGVAPEDTFRISRQDSPFVFAATTTNISEVSGVTDETTARIAADTAETNARIAADSTETANRIAADNAEAVARASADTSEANQRVAADALETHYRTIGDTAAAWMALDFSGLPTTDPGGGKVWLKSGDLHVGP